ncbi:MAG: hypothetical protein WA496_07620 [Candidatus Udaeobacter sp.]
MSTFFYGPPCRHCKAITKLARITSGRHGFDFRTFKCPDCDHVHQLEREIADPIKSIEIAGWLQGLHAPT